MTSLLVPPVSVRGMTRLDRDAFTTVVKVPILKLRVTNISKYTSILKKYLLKMHNFKPVQKTSDDVIIYLNPDIIKRLEDITENDRTFLSDQYEFDIIDLTLNYNNWSYDEILKSILPEDIQAPTSYSLIGHIVHLNLRDVHLSYKGIIGQIILDKVAKARTVVNKINTIDTTFRYFTMEIIAGNKDTVTTVKENGCMYQFDFAQVYWNPRLSTEHLQLATLMKAGDILYDVFAGVGPFSILAARKGINVFANDLNPEAFKWLQTNAVINKVATVLNAFNIDGRDFLRKVVKNDILRRRSQDLSGSEHIIMNLPASAIEFLDILPDWFTEEELKNVCLKPLLLHLYCFVKTDKKDDPFKLAKLLVEEKLGFRLSSDLYFNMHNVRDVSPNKEMIRVTLLLKEVIFKGEEPATKKLKVENTSSLSISNDVTEDYGKEQEYSSQEKCFQSRNSPQHQVKS